MLHQQTGTRSGGGSSQCATTVFTGQPLRFAVTVRQAKASVGDLADRQGYRKPGTRCPTSSRMSFPRSDDRPDTEGIDKDFATSAFVITHLRRGGVMGVGWDLFDNVLEHSHLFLPRAFSMLTTERHIFRRLRLHHRHSGVECCRYNLYARRPQKAQ